MAIKIVKVKEAIKDNGIKILVHAPAGTGKTVLAATACEATLIISAESGLLSLNNDELKEVNPHFMPELCDVVEVATIEELEEVYLMLEGQVGEPKWKWIGLDSITEIAEVVLANELESAKDPRKAYGELYNRVSTLLRMFRDLQNYNIYMASKQTPIKDDYSGLTIYSPMMPGAKLGNSIPYLFDEVLCLRVLKDDDGDDYRVLQTSRDIQFEAKDRSGKLDKFEAPSLKRISDKIRGIYEEPEEVEEVEENAIEEASEKETCEPDVPEKLIEDLKDEEVDKNSIDKEFAESLKSLDKQDLAALAIKLDEEIDQEVADDADIDTLIGWIVESSMSDIKEACVEIGLA